MESTEVFLPRIVSLLDEYYLYYCIRCYFVYVFNTDERIVQLCVIIHVYSRVGVQITIITNQSMSTVHLFTNTTNKTVNCKFTNVIISENALNYLFVTLFFLRILDVTVPLLIYIKHGTNLDILFVFYRRLD